jgi:hypothetical protein
MGLEYAIDRARSLITITGECAGAREWEALLVRALADPEWRPGLVALRDSRRRGVPVDVATVVETMAVVLRMWPSLRLRRAAIVTESVVPSPALVAHALADAENVPIRSFTSYDVAIDWLAGADVPNGS